MTQLLDRLDAVLVEPPQWQPIGPLPPEDIFFGAPRSETAFCGPAGLLQGPAFTAPELERIRELIKERIVENAHALSSHAAADIEAMRAALTKAGNTKSRIDVFADAQHGFNADYRDTYNEKDAKDAWARMLAWFKENGVA